MMRKICVVALLVLVGMLVGVSGVKAEPTGVIVKLMNEPITMLDFGMKCLEEEMKSIVEYRFDFDEYGIMFRYVGYNYDKDLIVISILIVDSKLENSKMAKDRIRKVIEVLNDNGNRNVDYIKAVIDECFSHKGFTNGNMQFEKDELYNKIQYDFDVNYKPESGTKTGRKIKSTCNLDGSDLMFSE